MGVYLMSKLSRVIERNKLSPEHHKLRYLIMIIMNVLCFQSILIMFAILINSNSIHLTLYMISFIGVISYGTIAITRKIILAEHDFLRSMSFSWDSVKNPFNRLEYSLMILVPGILLIGLIYLYSGIK